MTLSSGAQRTTPVILGLLGSQKSIKMGISCSSFGRVNGLDTTSFPGLFRLKLGRGGKSPGIEVGLDSPNDSLIYLGEKRQHLTTVYLTRR